MAAYANPVPVHSTAARTGGAPVAKAERVHDPAYLAHLRAQGCSFCPRGPRSQAHHTLPHRMGGANRRDDLACSVCVRCHMRCDGQTVAGLGPIPLDLQTAAAARQRAAYLAGK